MKMERKRYIDFLKVVAAFCIVLLHVNSNSVHSVQNFLSAFHGQMSFVVHQLLYLAVPIFVILTGCGMLTSGRLDYKSMWPKIGKIVLCIVLFGSIFEVTRIIIRHENITLVQYLNDLLNGTTWSHMWYLNKILGVYLIVPLLGCFIYKATRREVCLFTGLCFIFTCVVPQAAGMIGIPFRNIMPIDSVFVLYVMAGYLIDTMDEQVCRRYRWISVTLAFIGGAMIVRQAYVAGDIILEDNVLAVITAISIVFSAKGLIKNKSVPGRFLEEVSRCTFGIYIIHPIFVHLINYKTSFNPQLRFPWLMVPATGLVIFMISFVCIFIMRKIKIVRKYLL